MITLEQANAPLQPGEARFHCNVNLVIRGSFRRAAVSYGINYYEEKGLLMSTFIFHGEHAKVMMFHQAIKNLITS